MTPSNKDAEEAEKPYLSIVHLFMFLIGFVRLYDGGRGYSDNSVLQT